ncbi:unnamed protein product, partial [Heterosigma akashiwo]
MDLWDAAAEGAEDFYLCRVHWFPDGTLGAQARYAPLPLAPLPPCHHQLPPGRWAALGSKAPAATGLCLAARQLWTPKHLPPPPLEPNSKNDAGSSGSLSTNEFYQDYSSTFQENISNAEFSMKVRAIFAKCSFFFNQTWLDQQIEQKKAASPSQLTAGDWVVEAVVGVDQAKGLVYFLGNLDHPLEKHLYRRPLPLPLLAPGGPARPVRLTPAGGFYHAVMDHARPALLLRSSLSTTTANYILLCLCTVGKEDDPPQQFSVFASACSRTLILQGKDGVFEDISAETEIFKVELFAALYVPSATRHGPGPYPTVVAVYGGPHVQRVHRSWAQAVDMRAQYLRELGFLVIKCDNRGSARRGLAFEGAIRHNMGDVELRDQQDAVAHAVRRGLADPARVGIYGWSYGGYMSAMALCKAPDTFKVAVSGAPVTSWDGYDTHYTERYMGTPQANPQGYEASSVLAAAGRLRGRLLLVHGLIDENVHFRHTARLINALIAARKRYDLLLFPDERHSPRSLQ